MARRSASPAATARANPRCCRSSAGSCAPATGIGRGERAHRGASGARRRLQSRVHRPRERLHQRCHPRAFKRLEIDERFDAIARFADIGAFVDQPVKTYSSGMYVRLAFATAINVDPDILVVDEALSVGDEAFQRKCFARIEEIQERGGTILFVSHNPQSIVQLCSRAMLIDGGEVLLDADRDGRRPVSAADQPGRRGGAGGARGNPPARRFGGAPSGAECGPERIRPRRRAGAAAKFRRGPSAEGGRVSLEGYDPRARSRSRVSSTSATVPLIHDLRLLNAQGEHGQHPESGAAATPTSTSWISSVAATDIGFGMLINTTSGLGIGGATTAPLAGPAAPRA